MKQILGYLLGFTIFIVGIPALMWWVAGTPSWAEIPVARQVTLEDYDRFDRIICMDASNLRLIKRIVTDDPEEKIHLMMSYTGISRDVADPWYTGDFETTFQDLLEGCEAMLNL